VSWVIVTRDAYEAWEETTDSDADADLRISVLTWVLRLQDEGPPAGGIFDPFRETMFAQVGETGVWVEYLVLPYLEPPIIVIRRYR
jgi:hypothetical protein